MAMGELAKANNSVMKLGGNAIAREVTMKKLEDDLAYWKNWATKAFERVSELEKAGSKQRKEIVDLKKEAGEWGKE